MSDFHDASPSEAALVRRAQALVDKGLAPSVAAVSKRLFKDSRRIGDLAAGNSYLRPPTMRRVFEDLAALEADPPWRIARRRLSASPSSKGASDGEQHEAQKGTEEAAPQERGS